MPTIRERADDLFRDARDDMGDEILKLEARFAADGMLQSGGAIRSLVRVWRERTARALDDALQSASLKVTSRRREWSNAMDQVEQALLLHLDAAPSVLGKSLGKMSKDGLTLAEPLFRDATRAHLKTLKAYRDKWTAPPAKGWHERRPVFYAIALLVIGAMVSLAFSAAGPHLFGTSGS